MGVTDDWALCEVSRIIVKMLKISRGLIVPVSITLVCFVISPHLNIFTLAEDKSFSRNQENKDVDRVKMIEDKCDEYEERLRQDYEKYEEVENELEFTSPIMYNKYRGTPFIWCRTPKAASSSWTSIFLSQKYPETNDKQLSVIMKHLILINLWTASPDDEYIKEFLRQKKTDKLTFKYFIEYLVNLPLKYFDIHWMPMYLLCKPCQMKYDIIGRMCSLEEDSQKILSRLSLNQTLGHDHPTGGGSSDNKLVEYYTEVSPELMDKLYKLYEMDFILFNYERFY